MDKENLLTVPEVAVYLRLSVHTVRNWVCQNKIGFIKLGGRVLFRKEDLEDYIQSKFISPRQANDAVAADKADS
jgi:excisionase family DNA binding protein